MYSILIQNQKTMESFQHFHPLFLDALNKGEIGICQWFEAGTTVETAVPELYELIEDKQEWRALIVRFEDDAPMAAFETVPDNPYDFVENLPDDPTMRESDIPLIRLTHMLGGMPSPNVIFVSDVVTEHGKAPRMVYIPKVLEEDQREYRRLSEKYHLHAAPPSEIILISLRFRRDQRLENVERAWTQNNEINSSEFWKRNGYPSICRFTFFEAQRQGPTQRIADLFSAWMAVLLLARNDIDPSSLQAYKLLRLDVEYDRKQMAETIQNTAGRILSAREFIQKSIQAELRQKLNEEAPPPDYRLKAPVVLSLPNSKSFPPKASRFRLTSRTAFSDSNEWTDMERATEETLSKADVLTARAVDRTCEQMRRYTRYQPEEIFRLDEYQREDLRGQLDALSRSIEIQRAGLPTGSQAGRGRMKELSEAIRGKLRRRVTSSQVCVISSVTLAMFTLTMVPGFFDVSARGILSLDAALIALAGGATLLLAGIAQRLLLLRNRLRRDVSAYSGTANAEMLRYSLNADQYSEYLGNIASLMHGRSFLYGLQRKVFLQDEAMFYKRNHISALNAFLATLKTWSDAFHLAVSFDSADMDEYLSVDTDVLPYTNPLYTFHAIGSYSVGVNSSGDTIESPFNFVEKLIIEREELYDDAR